MKSTPSLVILAAGMGSRYGGLKQIDPVGPRGEIVIDYSIYDALRAGFGRVIFVIRRDLERVFREVVGSKFEGRTEVIYAFQELSQVPDGFQVPASRRKPWGTAHAILAAEGVAEEPFAVINADDYYGQTSFQVLASFLTGDGPGAEIPEYALVGFQLRNTLSDHGAVSRGICRVDEAGCLQSVTEMTRIEKRGDAAAHVHADGSTTPLSGDEWVSMNAWAFTPALFAELRTAFASFLARHGREEKAELYIPAVVDHLIRAGKARVRVLPTPDSWFGVTYPADKPTVVSGIRELVAAGRYPAPLWGRR